MSAVVEPAALQSIPLFHNLSSGDLVVLAEHLRASTFDCGTDLLLSQTQCAEVFILLRGAVKVCLDGTVGHDIILAICGTGEVIGEIAAIDGGAHSADVVTLERSVFLRIGSEAFCHCLRTIPELAFNLMQQQARRLRRISSHANALATLDIPGRLAWQINCLAEIYGQELPGGGVHIPLHLTQKDLAQLIGATRESVNKALVSFRQNRWISLDSSGTITLHNARAIQRVYA
jgi:CRP-like cAMP-binding protein